MTITNTNDRRENLRNVYLFVVDNWAVDVNELAGASDFTKDQVRSLLGTLKNKRLVDSTIVNGEGPALWQSYYDVQNGESREDAEAEFDSKFPNKVADTKTPAQVAKTRPAEGAVIYEVRKTRTTGAHVTLTNYSKGTGERRYVATCKTHGTEHAFDRRLPAESMCHHPEEWCDDCQVIDTTNGHEQTERALNPRYAVHEISVGSAGLTQRPAVYDTEDGFTVKVFQGKNGMANAIKYAAKLNSSAARP